MYRSPLGAKSSTIGLASPPASLVWANPAGRAGVAVAVAVAEAVKAVPSVPVTVAVSE